MMTLLGILLGIVFVIMLFLFILQTCEIKRISKILKNIRSENTNELIHSKYGGKSTTVLIKEINETLKEMRLSKIEYNRKSHNLKQMMTNISHDLRTPLTSAMGYIGIIRNSKLSAEEKAREIAIVDQRLIRLEELLNSFFELSKIISEDKQPDLEKINLVSVLEECIVHYYDDFSSRNREIIFHCNERKIEILSNKDLLMRVFDNLISNAYKHGEENLTITVKNFESVQISFANVLYDSKIDIERIFDEFYTTDLSRTKGNTGLGLAIAKQFIEMLGGCISAKYSENRFVVTVELFRPSMP
jgi:signal transduction histidine kinase